MHVALSRFEKKKKRTCAVDYLWRSADTSGERRVLEVPKWEKLVNCRTD